MMGKSRIIHSSDFKESPFWFKSVNTVWRLSYHLGTEVNLNKDKLIKAAVKNTGLKDFGIDFNDEPLDRLLYSLNTESDLHPVGKFITYKRLVNLLSVRLRA
jgi:hypothetical protein